MMKISSIVFLVFLAILNLDAQGYQPIIEDGKIWSTLTRKIRTLIPGEEDFVIDILTEQYSIGDTILLEDGKEWRKLYFTTDSLFVWDSPNLKLKGYIRENNQQLFFSHSSFNFPEEPIFDFNLELGDTARILIDTGEKSALIVSKIDTIIIDDNIPRKRYIFEKVDLLENGTIDLGQVIWVEGLGDLQRGLLPDYAPTIRSLDSLRCVSKNENLLYQNPNFVNCFFELKVGSKEVFEPISFNLYPNPCRNYAKIILPQNVEGVKKIVVFNSIGQPIFSVNSLSNRSDIYLETSNWPPGHYQVNIYFKDTSRYGISHLVKIL